MTKKLYFAWNVLGLQTTKAALITNPYSLNCSNKLYWMRRKKNRVVRGFLMFTWLCECGKETHSFNPFNDTQLRALKYRKTQKQTEWISFSNSLQKRIEIYQQRNKRVWREVQKYLWQWAKCGFNKMFRLHISTAINCKT